MKLFGFGNKMESVKIDYAMKYSLGVEKGLYADYGILLKVKPFFGEDPRPANPERMLEVLHGLENRFAFEIWHDDGQITFHVWAKDGGDCGLVKSQIAAQYPRAEIQVRDDRPFPLLSENTSVACARVRMTLPQYKPFETKFNADPLASILGTMSYLKEHEKAVVQVVLVPADAGWSSGADTEILSLQSGKSVGWIDPKTRPATETEKSMANVVSEKARKSAFYVDIKIMVNSEDAANAKNRTVELAKGFMHFNMSGGNKFTYNFIGEKEMPEFIADMGMRNAHDIPLIFGRNKWAMTTTELANIVHLPKPEIEIQDIEWAFIKPRMSPMTRAERHGTATNDPGLIVCESTYRDRKREVRLTEEDLDTHLAIFGKTGYGKSTLIANLALQKINEGKSVIVLDPHGDLVREIVPRINAERVKDVIFVNPLETPLRLNVLSIPNRDKLPQMEVDLRKDLVISDLVSTFKNIYGQEFWGPRLDYVFTTIAKGLMENDGTTLLDMYYILTNDKARKKFRETVKNEFVANFLDNELPQMKYEELLSTVNKVGKIAGNDMLRRMLCQRGETFDISKALSENKVLLIDLSKGKIGAENTHIIGSAIVTQIWVSVLQRSNFPELMRNQTYLFVDEFQDFANESFRQILSESRKYKLRLAVATQYTKQVESKIWDSIVGNLSTIVSFAVGADDAERLSHVYHNSTPDEFKQLEKYNVLVHRGATATGGVTLPLGEETNPQNMELVAGQNNGQTNDDSLVSGYVDWMEERLNVITALLGLTNMKNRETYSTYEIEKELENMGCPIPGSLVDAVLIDCANRGRVMRVWNGNSFEHRITEEGRTAIDKLMGSCSTAGGAEHKGMLQRRCEYLEKQGNTFRIVRQGGSAPLPDGNVVKGPYLDKISGGMMINEEIEHTTPSKPARILQNHKKARDEGHHCEFVVNSKETAEKIAEIMTTPYKVDKDGNFVNYNIEPGLEFVPCIAEPTSTEKPDWNIVIEKSSGVYEEYIVKVNKEEKTETSNENKTKAVENLLLQNKCACGPAFISKKLGYEENYVSNILSRLEAKKLIKNLGWGLWVHMKWAESKPGVMANG